MRADVARALILTYHAIEPGPAPLCVEPDLFRAHVDCIASSGARTVTVSELAGALAGAEPRMPTVAITFDDGFESIAETAAPLLDERGLSATVYCVAGRLGERSDWFSARAGGFVSQLADARAVAQLAARGFEIGSHGMEHEPLVGSDERLLQREVVDSRGVLERAAGTSVRSFAYPYGAGPSAAARVLVEETYETACTTNLGTIGAGPDLHALPRVEAHYLRNPKLLEKALRGWLDLYLRARGLGARARRVMREDYSLPASDRSGSSGPAE